MGENAKSVFHLGSKFIGDDEQIDIQEELR